MKFAEYHKEVEAKLRQAKATDKPSKFADLKKYVGTQYDFIGLSTPLQRKIFKEGFSFSHLPGKDQMVIWNDLWLESNVFEVMTLGIYFCDSYIKKAPVSEVWNVIKHWTIKIDNWAHSDGLSGLYSHLLEKDALLIFPQIERWNKSKNPWERRQSLVSLLEYSKKRKTVLSVGQMLPLVYNLINDKDYFVQKGVGWALREIGNVYPLETWSFLYTHHHLISPAAFTAAIEKRTHEEKEILRLLRKTHRAKKTS